MYLVNYLTLALLFFLVSVISIAVFGLSFLLFYQTYNAEKNSIYECGFVPFEDARNKFEIKFYLVSILFIVFDLEVVFLLPYVLSASKLGFLGSTFVFLFVLFVALGFTYEWRTGAMN